MLTDSIPAFIIDAFTDHAFAGNPAAVCILSEDKSALWHQQVAAEFNLSETAFIRQTKDNYWNLRWFTPTCEIELWGHATLASAHVLLNEMELPYNDIIFSTLSGNLTARMTGSGIKLDFPRVFCTPMESDLQQIADLKLNQLSVYRAGDDIILELENYRAVSAYQPDFAAIAKLKARGLIITAPGETGEVDFVSRVFAPGVGINEDPVTGSTHCSLASLWSERLGKTRLRARQLSARGGAIDVVVHPDRVDLIGTCVTVLQGALKNSL